MSPLSPYHHPRRIRRLLESLVPVVCPPEAGDLGLAPAIADHVELSMRSLPAPVRAALVAGLTTYDLAAAGDPRNRARRASALSPEQAARYFASWWQSSLAPRRELAKGVKGLVCLACYEMPAMKERLGYDPERWIAQVKARRHERYAADIRRHEDSLTRPDPLPSGGREAG